MVVAKPDKPPGIISEDVWRTSKVEIMRTREKMMSHIAHQSGRARGRVSDPSPYYTDDSADSQE